MCNCFSKLLLNREVMAEGLGAEVREGSALVEEFPPMPERLSKAKCQGLIEKTWPGSISDELCHRLLFLQQSRHPST